MKDYYKILGVEKNADDKTIKSSYRQLATQWHPDKHQNAPEEERNKAEEKFKEISEAYSVLSDKDKKQNYDATGDPKGNIFGFKTTGDPFDFMRGFGFGNRRSQQPNTMRGQTLQYFLELTLSEALFGTDKTVDYDVTSPCDSCNAQGATEFDICQTCGGNGMTVHRQENMVMQTTCRDCNGRGKKATNTCGGCGGQGVVSEHKTLKVKIPQAAYNGATLRVQGAGGKGLNGGIDGDLMIGLRVSMPDVSTLSAEERLELENLLSK